MQKITLIGDVNPEMLKDFLHEMAKYRKKPVEVEINSGGGDMAVGFAIADAIRAHGKITTVATGVVGSAAVPIFTSGRRRLIRPSATLFLHSPTMSGEYDLRSLGAEYAQLKRDYVTYMRHLFPKAKLTRQFIMCYIGRDRYFTAKRAIAEGLADALKEDF